MPETTAGGWRGWARKGEAWLTRLGSRPAALRWLIGLGIAESVIFPLPIDPLLAAMVIARKNSFVRLALLTGLASCLGGMIGWLLGYAISTELTGNTALLGFIGNDEKYAAVAAGFARHGWLLVFIGAFTPLPYKVIAVSAGLLGIGWLPFLTASLVGRNLRFLLVAAIVHHRGDIRKSGLLTCLLAVLFAFFWGVL